jgi:hypothetical protein
MTRQQKRNRKTGMNVCLATFKEKETVRVALSRSVRVTISSYVPATGSMKKGLPNLTVKWRSHASAAIYLEGRHALFAGLHGARRTSPFAR